MEEIMALNAFALFSAFALLATVIFY